LNKTGADRQLLARVLEDAQRAREDHGRAWSQSLESQLLRNSELFKRWTELTGGRHLVAYFAQHDHPNGAMQAADIAPITALLERSQDIENLDLLIHSPGGNPQTAEKIVAACRQVAKGEFRVAVPNMAKSAATMVALGSDQIVMGYLSELGPIDPQIPFTAGGGKRFISAQSFLDGQSDVLESIEQAQKDERSIIGYISLLNSADMSPAFIAEMRREIAFGQDLVSKYRLAANSSWSISSAVTEE
jgi:hypothetical protein